MGPPPKKSRFPNSQKNKKFLQVLLSERSKTINFYKSSFPNSQKKYKFLQVQISEWPKKIFLSKNFTSPEVGGRLGYSRKARKPSPTCFRGRILDEPGYFLGLLHF